MRTNYQPASGILPRKRSDSKWRFFLIRQYTTRCFFESFVQNVVDALREWDQSQKNSAGETMKMIGNCSYGYPIMNRSRKTKTEYLKGSNVDKLINKIIFMSINELSTFSVIQTNMSWLKWIMIEFTLALSEEKLDTIIRLEMRLLV